MTVDLEDLRAHVGPGPSDADLQVLLDAALEALVQRYGPSSETHREYLRPFGQWVKLGLRAEEVDDIIEGTTTLEEADFEIWPGGKFVRRVSDSTPIAWTGMVDVTYTPYSEDANRDRIVYALCDFALANPGGLAGITVGPWSEQYQTREPGDLVAEREAILDSLRPAMVGIW